MSKQIELSAGVIEYEDSGGDGPAVVLLPGLLMNASLWQEVSRELAPDARCIAPTLPFGAHRKPMAAAADLSLRGLASLVVEFIKRLELSDVTLVGNDTGGALVQLVLAGNGERVGRAVLVSCEAFENLPPGLTGKAVVASGRLPPRLFGLFMQHMRLRPVRRLPIAFGWLTKRGDEQTKLWMRPLLKDQAIRRDAVRVLRGISRERNVLLDAAERLPRFDRPVLVVWAKQDRVMPPEHGMRLTELFPQGRLVQIDDSYTLIPLDQPGALAQVLRDFLTHHEAPAPTA